MRLKHILGVLALVIVIFVAVIVVKTLTYPFDRPPAQYTLLEPDLTDEALQRLAGGLRIPTISGLNGRPESPARFDEFKLYLAEVYPDIYRTMRSAVVNNYGLVFCWQGRNPELKPLLLTAHYDTAPAPGYENLSDEAFGVVVFQPNDEPRPVIDAYQTLWEYPPFSGAVANGRIYGRGTLDDKGQLFAILEAADSLIKTGFQPARDIWLAFGHDEEVGGRQGAQQIADYFAAQNLRFDAVYDEGGVISTLAMLSPTAQRPVAVVGVAEKSFLLVKITVNGPSGHSSMPPANASIVQAAEIVTKLNARQMPAQLTGPVATFLQRAGGEMPFPARVAIANQWLLKPAIVKFMAGSPASNALVRTTTAITMLEGGVAPNVLSPTTEILINFRLLPEDSPEAVLAHVASLCTGYDVNIELMGGDRNVSRISPAESPAFRVIENSILKLYPNGIVAPYITIGATDALKYEALSDNVYRIMPVLLNQYELALMHGVNEHISIANYTKMVWYYQEIMRTY